MDSAGGSWQYVDRSPLCCRRMARCIACIHVLAWDCCCGRFAVVVAAWAMQDLELLEWGGNEAGVASADHCFNRAGCSAVSIKVVQGHFALWGAGCRECGQLVKQDRLFMFLQPFEAVPAMFCWKLPTASICPPVNVHQLSCSTACHVEQVLACNMPVWDAWWPLPLPSAHYYGFSIAALIDALGLHSQHLGESLKVFIAHHGPWGPLLFSLFGVFLHLFYPPSAVWLFCRLCRCGRGHGIVREHS